MDREEALQRAFVAFAFAMRVRELTMQEENAIEHAINAYMTCLAEQEAVLYQDVRGTPVSEALKR